MTLPNFLVIGAQKSGTSWLRDILPQHPMVYMPKDEVHFFDRDDNYKKGLAWYENCFADADGHKAVGEKTPAYLWANGRGVGGHLPNVHQNIHQALPHARLIISLRNPVERALSALNHLIRTGRISPLHRTDDLLFGSKQHLVQGQGLFERGYYYQQIQAYRQYFDPEQILILIFEEDIVEHPNVGLRKICNFLEIDDSFEFSNVHKKSNAYRYTKLDLLVRYYMPMLGRYTKIPSRFLPIEKNRPSDEAMEKLYKGFAKENEKLFEFLGREPVSWKASEKSRH